MSLFPVTLSIAGSDSGGGAGIQADIKTFTSLKVYGTTAITCITSQNPDRVSSIQEVPLEIIEDQIWSVLEFFPVNAVKTGMLFSEKIIRKVSEFAKNRNFQLVVDPVMVATSGALLLQKDAIESLKKDLLPYSDLITPNLDEAEILLNKKITIRPEMEASVKSIYELFGVPVLLKGGHLKNTDEATDVLFDGKNIHTFTKNFIHGVNSHGTGCTYSSAICAYLAKGHSLVESIYRAKEFLHFTISHSLPIGFQKVHSLNHLISK